MVADPRGILVVTRAKIKRPRNGHGRYRHAPRRALNSGRHTRLDGTRCACSRKAGLLIVQTPPADRWFKIIPPDGRRGSSTSGGQPFLITPRGMHHPHPSLILLMFSLFSNSTRGHFRFLHASPAASRAANSQEHRRSLEDARSAWASVVAYPEWGIPEQTHGGDPVRAGRARGRERHLRRP
jgi:hypothetical protein